MLVKICGITNPEDARTAVDAGADFVGLVFVERKSGARSKRFVPETDARTILRAIPEQTQAVGLFQNHDLDHVTGLVSRLALPIVQLHGDETPEYVNAFLARRPDCRIIKAFAVTGPETVAAMLAFHEAVRDRRQILAFLLDSPGGGGTGTGFDWPSAAAEISRIREKLPPIFLAGGLTIANLVEAMTVLRPDGVDVSSGVEASPGRKDADKVRTFIRLAKQWI